MVKGLPRIFVFIASLVCLSTVLLGCTFTPTDSIQDPAPSRVSPDTWREVYEAVFAASVAAEGEAEAYARTAMEEWIDKVRQRTEAEFVSWYGAYWTRQWLDLKAAWYAANGSEAGATTAERLAAYLRVQYGARVLDPVRREIDPDKVVDDAASVYVHALRDELQRLPDRYHVPPDELHQRLDQIPAIVPPSDPRQNVSLYQLMQASDITQTLAYAALVAPIRSAGGVIALQPLWDRLDTVAAAIADEAGGKLAVRGTATAASAMLGGVGILLGMGITAWQAAEHSSAQPGLEAELRQQLGLGLDAVWSDALANLDTTVLVAVHHMSSNIDISLLRPQTD
jgi:hypothetical protein